MYYNKYINVEIRQRQRLLRSISDDSGRKGRSSFLGFSDCRDIPSLDLSKVVTLRDMIF